MSLFDAAIGAFVFYRLFDMLGNTNQIVKPSHESSTECQRVPAYQEITIGARQRPGFWVFNFNTILLIFLVVFLVLGVEMYISDMSGPDIFHDNASHYDYVN